jgi:hypothetical protein
MNKSNLAVSHCLTSAELPSLSTGAEISVNDRLATPSWFTKRNMTLNVVTIVSIIGLTLASAAAVWAEDEKPQAKSSASSSAESSSKKNSNTKIEVRVVEEKSIDDSSNAPKRSSSRTFSAQSSNSESVDKAIDEVQKKLREIDLPEHLQNQAVEMLRKFPASGNVTLGLINGKEGEQHTYTFQTPNFFSATVSPELRSRLMKSIEKAIDEENLESEVAKRLMEKVKVAIDKAGKVGGQATAKYRIGIQLEVEGAKNDSDSGNDSREKELGIGVKEVFEDTPAAKAGLKAGDRILSANGKTIHAPEALIDMVQEAGESKKPIELVVNSEGKERTLSIQPDESTVVDFNMPQLKGMNPQAWLVNPQGWVNGMPMPGGPALRLNRTDKVGEKNDSSNSEKQREILEELKELEGEVAEMKSMLKQLIER